MGPCAIEGRGALAPKLVAYPEESTGSSFCSDGILKLGISGTMDTRLSRGGDRLPLRSFLANWPAGERAGPDLVLRIIGLALLLPGLVGDALLLPLELRPPSLLDLPTLAELYLTGIGMGGRELSPDPRDDSELFAW